MLKSIILSSILYINVVLCDVAVNSQHDTVKEQSDVIFNCTATTPDLKYKTDYYKIQTNGTETHLLWWIKAYNISFIDTTLSTRVTKISQTGYGNSSIILSQVSPRDEGQYKCVITYIEKDNPPPETTLFNLSIGDNGTPYLIPDEINKNKTTTSTTSTSTTTTSPTTTSTPSTTTPTTTTSTTSTTTSTTTTSTTSTTTTSPTTTTSTTTTTSPPDTTTPPATTTPSPSPAPTPSQPVVYNVTENNITCMMLQSNISLNINYTTNKVHKHYFTKTITVPSYEEGGRVLNSSCDVNKDGSQTLLIGWNVSVWSNNMSFIFNQTEDKKKWKLQKIILNIQFDGINFPNATHENETLIITIEPNMDPTDIAMNHSYQCTPLMGIKSQKTVYHTNPYPMNITVNVTNLQMQAFNQLKSPNNEFMQGEVCGVHPRDKVPVIVGIVLGTFFLVVFMGVAGWQGRKFYLKRRATPPYGPL